MTGDKPEFTVESESFTIRVSSQREAEMALPAVQQLFVEWLGKAPQAGRMAKPEPWKEKVPTECPHCGYQWTFNGLYPTEATCPECNSHLNAFENAVGAVE